MPFFSVIVPVYNAQKYLIQCIESVLNQSFESFELILVDDGSRDASGEICDAYAARDARIQVIHKPNGGVVSARKAGLQKSRGSYIVNMDSDDYIAPDYLRHYWDIIQKKRPEIIADNFALVSEQGHFLEEFHQLTPAGFYSGADLQRVCRRLLYDFHAALHNCGSVSWNIWSKAIKRELALAVQPPVPDRIGTGEDCAVIIPAICVAESLYVTDYCGYYYRQVPSSMVHTCNPGEAESLWMLGQYLRSRDLRIPEGNFVAFFGLRLWGQTVKAARALDSAKALGAHMRSNYGEIISYVTEGMKRWPVPKGLKRRMVPVRYGMWYVIWRKYHK